MSFEILALIWALIIAFAIFAYIMLDGFDLGVGILFPFYKDKEDRSQMIRSISPVWDGNETWLVLGGGGLFAVFPLAYSVILSALYMPVIGMLLSLCLRGVSIEFREATDNKKLWDFTFSFGSACTAFCQGLMLGSLVQGIRISGRSYSGGWFDWLTPFTILTGFALVIGYAMLGAGWLHYKTTGPLQDRARTQCRFLGTTLVALVGLFSLLTAYMKPEYTQRWLGHPEIFFTALVPILFLIFYVLMIKALKARKDYMPFFWMLWLFTLCYIGIAISIYPYIVPTSITIWQAAAPKNSLSFLLVGGIVLIPTLIAYNAYAYWVFRGKVRAEDHY